MWRLIVILLGIVVLLFAPVNAPNADDLADIGVGAVLPGNTEISAPNFVVILPSGAKWRLGATSRTKDGRTQHDFGREGGGVSATTFIRLESYVIPPTERAEILSMRDLFCAQPSAQGTQVRDCHRYFLRFVLMSVVRMQMTKASESTRLKIVKFVTSEAPHPECMSWHGEAEDRQVPGHPGTLFIQSDRAVICLIGEFEERILIVYSYRAPAETRDARRFEREAESVIGNLRLREAARGLDY